MAAYPVNNVTDVEFLLKNLTGLPEDPKQTVIQLQEYKDGVGKHIFQWESLLSIQGTHIPETRALPIKGWHDYRLAPK